MGCGFLFSIIFQLVEWAEIQARNCYSRISIAKIAKTQQAQSQQILDELWLKCLEFKLQIKVNFYIYKLFKTKF